MLKYFRVKDADVLPDISKFKPYKAVLVLEAQFNTEVQASISTWLVSSGCLYMMAWGVECSSWDDSVDFANLELFDYGEIPDEDFVMTTWHVSEPLEEVFFFAKNCAIHSAVNIENVLILHFGTKYGESELLGKYELA